ncbi:MAG: ATP-binding protein [Clostridia bacterium]|nr:ATP-binding protein [Clostridia bacterium]MDD4048174.1 ATP-binding protein [Clostridia bacterium]
MRKKIFFYYLILVVTGVSIMAFFMTKEAHNLYQNELEEKLIYSTKLIGWELLQNGREDEEVDYNRAAHEYAKILTGDNINTTITATRITFIDYEGNVLGESEADYRLMENHKDRKEIREAIEKGSGMDIRSSGTLKSKFLYIARSLPELGVVTRMAVPMIQVEKIDWDILKYSIVVFLAGIIITSLLAWRFSHILLKPIDALAMAMDEVSQGDYSTRVRYTKNDEFKALSDGFNDMAQKLEVSVVELKDKNAKVELILDNMINGIIAVDYNSRIILINSVACEMFDIESVKHALETNFIENIRNNQLNLMINETMTDDVTLVKEINMSVPEERVFRVYSSPIRASSGSVDKLGVIISIHDITKIKKLEQIKTEFVSNVTHELKTPLTSIRGFVETLRNGAINKLEVANQFLEIIDVEAERLYVLINDILQLSEIETMPKDVQIDDYLLKPIVEEVLSIVDEVARKKNITIEIEIPEELGIKANKNRIKQMMINLLDNAVKYNVDNGSIRIKAFHSKDGIVISVRDTGIGIAKEHLDRIFERFYRVDKGRSRDIGGTGLGLSIVKHIVNLYDGHIQVDSEPDRGTEFIVSLPDKCLFEEES